VLAVGGTEDAIAAAREVIDAAARQDTDHAEHAARADHAGAESTAVPRAQPAPEGAE
jgi:hypothetical protein